MDKFWSKVNVSGLDECWPWTGSTKSNGYGQCGLGRRGLSNSSHRTAYILTHGPIPESMHILHTCDVRSCCNPTHLFSGTHQDNMMDMRSKGRQVKHSEEYKRSISLRMSYQNPMKNLDIVRKVHGDREYLVGESNGNHKLTEEEVLSIYHDPRFQYVIAMEYGVSQSTVNRIKTYQSWEHITQKEKHHA